MQPTASSQPVQGTGIGDGNFYLCTGRHCIAVVFPVLVVFCVFLVVFCVFLVVFCVFLVVFCVFLVLFFF